MISIKDIAARCGVSSATVSKALNGHKDIGRDTAARICKAAEEMGYTVNPLARALKTNRTYNIGILFEYAVCSGFSQDFFALILDCFRAEAEKRGYDVTYINHNGMQPSFLQHSKYRGFDGVAVINADYESPELMELIRSDLPVVTLDYTFDGCSAVCSDNYKGMQKLTNHLCSLGHSRIAYIHGELTAVTKERISGYFRVLREKGIRLSEDYVKEGRYHDIERSTSLALELLQLPEPPTCIIFPDDYSCLGARETLRRAGVRIPEDVSVAGYDGINMARILGITTYAQNPEAIGKKAAEKLIERIDNREVEPEHIEIGGNLLPGDTVRRL